MWKMVAHSPRDLTVSHWAPGVSMNRKTLATEGKYNREKSINKKYIDTTSLLVRLFVSGKADSSVESVRANNEGSKHSRQNLYFLLSLEFSSLALRSSRAAAPVFSFFNFRLSDKFVGENIIVKIL